MTANDIVFSWAESQATGRLVQVDDVPRGLQCGCVCPYCHEQLLARHGEVNEHGFAHHSNQRGANLKICYMVTLFKLAEQILQTHKKVMAPSYFGIFKEKTIDFIEVKTDGRFEREDKQPDVIATTKEGEQYLIEFLFGEEVRHRAKIDYENMTCLEVDLSKQTLESLEHFLLGSCKDRKWANNKQYFDSIEAIYQKHDKKVRVVNEAECQRCHLLHNCCCVKNGTSSAPLHILHNGSQFRLCKPDVREEKIEAIEQQKREAELERQRRKERQDMIENANPSVRYEIKSPLPDLPPEEPHLRSCLNCKINLKYFNRDGIPYCGSSGSFHTPRRPDPSYAQTCRFYRRDK